MGLRFVEIGIVLFQLFVQFSPANVTCSPRGTGVHFQGPPVSSVWNVLWVHFAVLWRRQMFVLESLGFTCIIHIDIPPLVALLSDKEPKTILKEACQTPEKETLPSKHGMVGPLLETGWLGSRQRTNHGPMWKTYNLFFVGGQVSGPSMG